MLVGGNDTNDIIEFLKLSGDNMNKIPLIPDINLVKEILSHSTCLDDNKEIKKVFSYLAFHVYRREEFIYKCNGDKNE